MAGDGQVTFGQTVMKQSARKIRRLYNDRILAGFAGSAADSFALFSRFESKLEQYRGNLERSVVELAKDWRSDRILRRLEAMLIVLDHDDGRYWRGLAVAMHRMKALPIAETLYTITLRIDPSDLISRVFRAEVMAQQGRRTAAWLELEATLELFKAHPMPEHAAYKQRAETLAASIKSTDASAAEVEN